MIALLDSMMIGAYNWVPVQYMYKTDFYSLPCNLHVVSSFRVRTGKFLPIIQHNVLKSRLAHYQLLNTSSTEVNITVNVAPASYGSLRLALHVRLALEQLFSLGFSEKDVDDVKGIFADTNLYLLSATVLIASCHVSMTTQHLLDIMHVWY